MNTSQINRRGRLTDQGRTFTSIAVLAVVSFVVPRAALSAPIILPPGTDTFRTTFSPTNPANNTTFTFSNTLIPAGFFGVGSDAFAGEVTFVGVPLVTSPVGVLGDADTVVERLGATTLDVGQTSASIPVEMIALQLTSVQPITVTFNVGATSELWDVDVCLSSAPAGQQGTITLKRTSPDGGTMDSNFPVIPLFTFRQQVGGGVLTIDCDPNLANCVMPLIGTGNAWAIVGGPGGLDRADFRGLTNSSHVIVAPGPVSIDTNCDSVADTTTQGESNLQVGVRDAGGGYFECVINKEAENALAAGNGNHSAYLNTPGDANNNGIPDACEADIPAVSEWGLIAMVLLVLAAGTLVLRRGRRAMA